MNEHEALQVLLVKSFETQAPDSELLSEADRREATRSALDAVGAHGAPDAFIAARAQAASRSLAGQGSQVDWMLERRGWHSTWLLLAIGIGLLVGITADVFGSGRQLNLLAPPAWLVILWNLGVYIVLVYSMLGQDQRKASASLRVDRAVQPLRSGIFASSSAAACFPCCGAAVQRIDWILAWRGPAPVSRWRRPDW